MPISSTLTTAFASPTWDADSLCLTFTHLSGSGVFAAVALWNLRRPEAGGQRLPLAAPDLATANVRINILHLPSVNSSIIYCLRCAIPRFMESIGKFLRVSLQVRRRES